MNLRQKRILLSQLSVNHVIDYDDSIMEDRMT